MESFHLGVGVRVDQVEADRVRTGDRQGSPADEGRDAAVAGGADELAVQEHAGGGCRHGQGDRLRDQADAVGGGQLDLLARGGGHGREEATVGGRRHGDGLAGRQVVERQRQRAAADHGVAASADGDRGRGLRSQHDEARHDLRREHHVTEDRHVDVVGDGDAGAGDVEVVGDGSGLLGGAEARILRVGDVDHRDAGEAVGDDEEVAGLAEAACTAARGNGLLCRGWAGLEMSTTAMPELPPER